MKEAIKKILEFTVRIKLYMTRSMSYMSMINSAMILVVLLSTLNTQYDTGISIRKWVIPLIIIGTIGLIGWGYFEHKIGLWQYEKSISFEQISSLKRLEDKLDKVLNEKENNRPGNGRTIRGFNNNISK